MSEANKTADKSFAESLLGCIGVFALIPAIVCAEGYITSLLWEWFLVPLGIVKISISQAIGIALLSSILTHQNQPKSAVKSEPFELLGGIIGRLGMCLLTAWIVHKLM